MTTPTPGTLLKLLQSMNTDTKVGGEHRLVILQVIGIVPALYGPELWPNHGFYIQLSDSVNSTYVSLPDSDADAIQLGQFVHLDRLRFDPPSSVPRACGLRPVPGSRPNSFVGSPEPLVARVSSNHTGFVIQTAPSDQPPPPPPPMIAGNRGEEETHERKVFVAAKNRDSTTAVKRRFSSPASSKTMGRKNNDSGGGSADCQSSTSVRTVSRQSSPALVRRNSRASSPIPSKCEVPGLVAAKEENRRVSREAAIVVPSRYRQPSPVNVRKAIASSPTSRRISSSPGRRLSGGFRVSPLVSEGVSKKKMVAMVAGVSKISDVLTGSSRCARKSWDDGPLDSNSSSECSNQKEGSKSKNNKANHQDILRTQVAITRRLSDANGKQSNLDAETSIPEKPTTSQKKNSTAPEKFARATQKITFHDRKWTDGSFSLDVLPENLSRLGKEAIQRKNAASVAAAEALEEACATESIIRNLSFFSDLFSTAKVWNPIPTINRFLSMYDDVLKHIVVAESLAARRSGGGTNDTESTCRYKSISLWIDAALGTDLEVISLLNNGTGSPLPKQRSPLKPSGKVSINLPKRNSIGTPSKNHTKPSSRHGFSGVWVRGSGLEETLELGLSLKSEMEKWFLKFVEEALDAGFQLLGHNFAGAAGDISSPTSIQEKNGRVAVVLSHLKRVNEWLDTVGKKMDPSSRQTIERLKKMIYGFVIRHVGCAFDNAVSLAAP